MVNTMLARLFCRQYAPLLVPYAENALDEPQRSRVARHLDACPGCRAEIAMLSDMGALLRSNPPAAPAPAPDLWKRIEAQIMAEQPATPISRPIPVPATVNLRSQWRSFGQSFGYSVLPVAAVVAGIVLLVRPFAHRPTAGEGMDKTASVVAARRHEVEMVIMPPHPQSPAPMKLRDSLGAKAIAAESSKAEQKKTAPIVVASVEQKPRPTRRVFRVTTPRLRTPAPVAVPTVPYPATSVAVAESLHAPVTTFAGSGGRMMDPDSNNMALRPPAMAPSVMVAAKPTTNVIAMASPETPEGPGEKIASRVNLEIERKVVLASEEVILPVREVTAERRVSEVTDEMFRHRNMFSYTR